MASSAGMHRPGSTCNTSEAWMKWKVHTDSLRSALSSSSPASGDGDEGAQKAYLAQMVARCMQLYKDTFHSSVPLQSDANSFALASIAGQYCTPLETAFMWIGGWRPTSAITLVFSTLGLRTDQMITLLPAPGHSHSHSQQQLHSSINAALLNNTKGSSSSFSSTSPYPSTEGMISDEELVAVEALRRKVLDMEVHLSNELASLQMLLPDEGLMAEALCTKNVGITSKGYEFMESKVSQMAHLFSQANQLRLNVLEDLLALLNPIHSALCCIAAFELLHALKSLD